MHNEFVYLPASYESEKQSKFDINLTSILFWYNFSSFGFRKLKFVTGILFSKPQVSPTKLTFNSESAAKNRIK